MTSPIYIVFHPNSVGISEGNRGPWNEIRASHPSLEAALQGKGRTPKTGFIAVEITDASGEILWKRTASKHFDVRDSNW